MPDTNEPTIEDRVHEMMSHNLNNMTKVRKHLLEAQKHNLLAVKGLIDGATEWLDKEIERAVDRIEKTEQEKASKDA